MINKSNLYFRLVKKQSGFTLIELMVTVAIVAIIAAIAVPSYSKYVIRNAESITISELKILEIQLEKWKSSALTYRGFIPTRGKGVCTKAADEDKAKEYCYDAENTDIFVPKGSNVNNYVYRIRLVDSLSSTTLAAATDGKVAITVGRGWRMVATPNPLGSAKYGRTYLTTSTGVQCRTKDATINKASTSCGSDPTTETW